ncbi:hypothetical protein PRIPAC_96356 [Pristionchus pacificus]|uniref:Uncharacterized protein n=1 Tax=Pristionchus pacificus TaxID=54126 RepID=A0A2A6D0L6_PRIPA|nr:hypothetical protein PRIPAC_96356 [Pristionchus pacificus]|eukprot:PDM84022.1 hypothetical protein PRIPAC_34214 [Pristionchus pacificus]
MRWIILLLLSTIHLICATLPQDHLSKDEYEDIVRMVFKYIYAHEDICGGILSDEKWMPAGTDCFIPCEYTSNICLLKAQDRSDPHQYCKQLPSRCVAGIRREVGTSYLVPTQAPVDPGLYYYGRGYKPTTAAPEEQIHPIEKEIYQTITENREPYIPERSLKTIERDNQILFDPSSNSIFGPPRITKTRLPPPSQPPAHVPYILPTESNPYLEQYFRGRKTSMEPADPLPVSPSLSPSMDIRIGNSLGLGNNRKTNAHTILYEGTNGEVIARGPAFDQKSPPLPIFLGDDKAFSSSGKGTDGAHKLVELSEEEILGGFKHSSGLVRDNGGEIMALFPLGKRVDLFASCCQWAVAGMCDSHWRKVRHVCIKSCGSMVCEEANGMKACSRVLDVDITECYDSLPKLIGLRQPNSHEQPEFEQSLKDTTRNQIESTSQYLADSTKTRHQSKRREDPPVSTTTTTTSAPMTTAKVSIRPQRRTSTTAPFAKRRSESVVIASRGVVKPRFVSKPAKIQREQSLPRFVNSTTATSSPPVVRNEEDRKVERSQAVKVRSSQPVKKRFKMHNGDFHVLGRSATRGGAQIESSSKKKHPPRNSTNNPVRSPSRNEGNHLQGLSRRRIGQARFAH